MGTPQGSKGTRRGAGQSLARAAKRLEQLTRLPKIYEPFSSRPYFFESALRVPPSLTPASYALETVLASELVLRGL